MQEQNEYVLSEFYKIITPNKVEMFDRIAAERTNYLTIALENIYQEHNASAVIRTCDCFGIQTLNVIEKENQYALKRDIALGAGRWVDLKNFNEGDNPSIDCIKKLKKENYTIVATSPHAKQWSIHDMPLEKPIALFFGTERRGLSQELINEADLLVHLPMYGFTESFNISVSVAIALNTLRQRLEKSKLNWKLTESDQTELKVKWCRKILNGGEHIEKQFRTQFLEKEL
jgi:tRNA (guanosine-2'-O-)-methyltransferase